MVHAVAVGLVTLLSYLASTHGLALVPGINARDVSLGGMWAAVAGVFVYRQDIVMSRGLAWTRVAATMLSFVLCELYLVAFPVTAVGVAVVVALGVLVLRLVRLERDEVTASITSIVVLVVALGSSDSPWVQPLLRLFDTVVGTVLGLAVARLATTVSGVRKGRPAADADTA